MSGSLSAARRWRLLETPPLPGPLNMAIDELLWRQVQAGQPPVLRLYQWSPPAVSIGYFQVAAAELDLEACGRLGVTPVRRLTGGRAVLHDDEVTYSVCMPTDEPAAGTGVLDSSRRLGQVLVAGLRRLGVPAQLAAGRGPRGGPEAGQAAPGDPVAPRPAGGLAAGGPKGPCFDAASWYEVVAAGRKLVGSAQMRRGGAVLQHGSIPLWLDPERQCAVLRFPSPEARQRAAAALARRATGLAQVLGRRVAPAEVAAALAGAWAEELGVRLERWEPPPSFWAEAEGLAAARYAATDWLSGPARQGQGAGARPGAAGGGSGPVRPLGAEQRDVS